MSGLKPHQIEAIRKSQEDAIARMEQRMRNVSYLLDQASAQHEAGIVPVAVHSTEPLDAEHSNFPILTPPPPPHIDADSPSPQPFTTAVEAMMAARDLFAVPFEKFHAVTENFGWRRHPITQGPQMHPALDLLGEGVVAARSGKVIFAGTYGGHGNHIKIDHGDGSVTAYSHLQGIPEYLKRAGANPVRVEQGQFIGEVGNTGFSKGAHLHFSICLKLGGCQEDADFTDPRIYLALPECPAKNCPEFVPPIARVARRGSR